MSKNRGVQYSREEWLARRASPSLGRVLRSRGHYVHITQAIIDNPKAADHLPAVPKRIAGPARQYFNRARRVILSHTAVNKGRNLRKQLVHETCTSRKQWTPVQ